MAYDPLAKLNPALPRDYVYLAGQPDLKPSRRQVLVVMSRFADFDTGESIHPGTATLMAFTGLSRGTVRAAKRELLDLGIIIEVRAATPTDPAEYRFALPGLSAAPGAEVPPAQIQKVPQGGEETAPGEVQESHLSGAAVAPNQSITNQIPITTSLEDLKKGHPDLWKAALETADRNGAKTEAYALKVFENSLAKRNQREKGNADHEAWQRAVAACSLCNASGHCGWKGGQPVAVDDPEAKEHGPCPHPAQGRRLD